MLKIALTLLSAICMFLTSCDYYNHSLVITNNSKKPISILESNTRLPEREGNYVAYYLSQQIDTAANYNLVINGRENAWIDYINDGPEKKLYLYAFDIDTLKLYNEGWSMRELLADHKYSHIFRYSKEELDKVGWNVVVK